MILQVKTLILHCDCPGDCESPFGDLSSGVRLEYVFCTGSGEFLELERLKEGECLCRGGGDGECGDLDSLQDFDRDLVTF